MRRGDIIVNPWVSKDFYGELNPNYATIYLGNNESLAYTGEVCEWADKVYMDNPDRMTPWKVIGHIDLDTIIETAIREAVKTEPSDSEKPNNCETCKHNHKEWWELPCDWCCGTHGGYEPKTEPQTDEDCDYCKMTHKYWYEHCGCCEHKPKDEPQVRSNLEPLGVDEPQTDCAWGRGEL